MKSNAGDYPVPPVLQDPHLVVTSNHVWHMRGNKAIGFIAMSAWDFLKLTTPDAAHLFGVEDSALPLEEYNRFAEEGESVLPPFVKVDMRTGRILSHEGRHRAAALRKADPLARMWVAVILAKDWYAQYYRDVPTGPQPWDARREFLSAGDIPPTWEGQDFNIPRQQHAFVSVDRRSFFPIWDQGELE